LTIRRLPFTLRVTPVLAAQETDDLTQVGQSGSGTVLHRLEHLVGTLRILVPQSRGRLGAAHSRGGRLLAAGLPAGRAGLMAASLQALTASRFPGPYPPDVQASRFPEVVWGLQASS